MHLSISRTNLENLALFSCLSFSEREVAPISFRFLYFVSTVSNLDCKSTQSAFFRTSISFVAFNSDKSDLFSSFNVRHISMSRSILSFNLFSISC